MDFSFDECHSDGGNLLPIYEVINMGDDMWYLAGAVESVGFLKPEFELFGSDLDGTLLGPLDRINIFVGANNSGKSRLIRRITTGGVYRLGITNQMDTASIAKEIHKILPTITFENPTISVWKHISENEFPVIRPLLDELAKYQRYSYRESDITIDYRRHLTEDISILFEDINSFWHSPTRNDQIGFRIEQILSSKATSKLESGGREDWKHYLKGTALALDLLLSISTLTNQEIYSLNFGNHCVIQNNITKDYEKVEQLKVLIESFIQSEFKAINLFPEVYIPILRSTHRLLDQDGTIVNPKIFEITTRKNYEKELKAFTRIFTGQSLFHAIVKARNGKREERKNFEAFEMFLSKHFFGNRTLDIVAEIHDSEVTDESQPLLKEKTIIIHIEGDQDREIHKLGDGIQALIMLTFPIFMAEANSFIFIEEPELNLHPGMQRIFLDVIAKNEDIQKKNLTFFMTTHSNHFLDLTITEDAPVSIFALRKKADAKVGEVQFEIRNVHSGEKGILDELGVQNSSVFIGNCSLWVEGITDRKYIRRYLDAYMEKHPKETSFKEDMHYVFFEYAGSNLGHYTFEDGDQPEIKAKRLSNRIMVIADQDEKKQGKHDFLNSISNEDFVYRSLLTVREIENLLSKEVVEKAVPKMFPKLKGKQYSFDWGKVKGNDYNIKPLLDSIIKAIGKQNYLSGYPNAKKFTTMPSSAKMNLCDFACKGDILTWDNMTLEAQELTKDIYKFIAESNKS